MLNGKPLFSSLSPITTEFYCLRMPTMGHSNLHNFHLFSYAESEFNKIEGHRDSLGLKSGSILAAPDKRPDTNDDVG